MYPLWLLVIIPAVAYCLVNSILITLQLRYSLQIQRTQYFFKEALGKTAFSIFCVLVFIAIFSSMLYRTRILMEKISCAATPGYLCDLKIYLLLQTTVLLTIIFTVVKTAIQAYMYHTDYLRLPWFDLLRILIISNSVAGLMQYMVVHLFLPCSVCV